LIRGNPAQWRTNGGCRAGSRRRRFRFSTLALRATSANAGGTREEIGARLWLVVVGLRRGGELVELSFEYVVEVVHEEADSGSLTRRPA
jgi:hypothetical protein